MKKRKRLYAVSNAHLDTQWNWTIKDTIVDCVKNTMDNNFALFEKYPSYKFNFEGAFRYKLMKEYYPEKYEKVKEYVKKGNWIPVGGAWDSMDVNVPSSEALMRQVLYGNKYFEKEFQKVTEDIFLPDCFGFRAALPSIASHMGLIGFSTQKLVWGVGSPMLSENGEVLKPMVNKELPRIDLARWKGPDGNEIFASFLSGNYTFNFDKNSDERPIKERPELLELVDHNGKYSGVYARNYYYGTGDYGGSCTEGSARLLDEAIKDEGKGDFDVVIASPTQIYHDLTKEEIDSIPVYEGGLLIPHGYGAMTSHSAMKRLNRKNELAADKAERAAILANLVADAEYPQERIEEGWKSFLWHQFHDDITGTSIADAYLYSHNDMVIAGNIFAKETQNSVGAITDAMNTDLEGTPIAVYNPCAFERSEKITVKLEGVELKSPIVKTADGKALATYCVPTKDGLVVSFIAPLKPVSVEIFSLSEGEGLVCNELYIAENTIENKYLSVKVNENGDICSIYDKTLGKELLSAPIREEIFEDNSTVWPSWEYNFDDLQKTPATLKGEVSVEVLDQRPVSVGLKITVKAGASVYNKTLTLEKDKKGLLIDATTDWHERNSLLTIKFPFSAENEKALFDGDLGAELGENTNTYPYFIHNMHKWADLTDKSGAYGITVANDCKYAAAKPDNNSLSFVLIHTPKDNYMPASGQDFQDMGYNRYSFYVQAHEGVDPAVNSALALNNSAIAYEVEKHTGNKTAISLIDEIPEGVEIRAIKKAEDSSSVIIRLQESFAREHKGVKIKLNGCKINRAVTCNGYEQEKEGNIKVEDGAVVIDIAKYGVMTLKLDVEYLEKTSVKNKTRAIALDYDLDIVCATGEEKAEQGIYIPSELYPSTIKSCSVEYTLSHGKLGALASKGQAIQLDKGYNKIKILAAVKNDPKTVRFKVEGEEKSLKISSFTGFVGSREMVVNGSGNKNTEDEIAYVVTHTKNEKGEDRVYDFAYIFAYELETNGAEKITLPVDPDLMIFAMTQVDSNDVKALTPIFDVIPGSEDAPKHLLTVNGLKKGGGYYQEGASVLLHAPIVIENGLFNRFEGEGILFTDGGRALVKMGDHDISVTAIYDILGENIALNKPCSANHFMNDRESPDKALNGKGRGKWCGNQDENGECTLNIDLENTYEPKSYLICHAGAIESKDWNTVDFDILVKEKEEDEFVVADSVRGNVEDVTTRSLNCGKVRYVTLKIYKPASDGDTHARIYQFGLFE